MARVRSERAALLATVLFAGATFWFAPRPPMVDLPQHAGQVALWHDLLVGGSRWQPLVYLNYFTPYLAGEAVALLLSFVLPVATALKVVLSLAYFGFVAACVALRRQLGGDARLDWLFAPGFLGFACGLGLYTFLVAAPLGVLFMVLAHRHAGRPSAGNGAILFLADIALFYSHGLVFLLANAVGGLFLLLKCRGWSRLLPALPPYAAAGLLCVAYAAMRMRSDTAVTVEVYRTAWFWDLSRLDFIAFAIGWPVGRKWTADWFLGVLVLVMLVTPFALGARLNRREPAALVPLVVTCCIWLFVPLTAFNLALLYPRFALFLLPSWALLFAAPSDARHSDGLAALWLPFVCWAFLAVRSEELLAFGRESATFEDVLDAAQPGHRAANLMFDPVSPAADDLVAYFHYPLWYQAEKGGLVDYNFAVTLGQVVRYRPDRMPALFTSPNWTWRRSEDLDWTREEATYRYYFVRATGPLPENFFPTGRCAPVLVKNSGPWSLFENVNCYRGPLGP